MERGLGRVQGIALRLAGAFGVGFAIEGITRDAIQTAAGYEAVLSEIRAVGSLTEEQMRAVEERTRSLGESTSFSAREAGEGFAFLIRAGFDVGEALEGIGPALALARAGNIELARSADIASNILSAARLPTEDFTRVTDILAATAASANTNVEQLGAAFRFFGPTVGQYAVDVEEAAAAIGILGNNGIQGALAGTNLRAVYARLINPTTEARKAIEALGLDVAKLNPVTQSLTTIIEELSKAQGDATTVARQMAKVFGTEAVGAIQILTSQFDDFKLLDAALRSNEISAEDVARVMGDNLLGAVKELRSALEELYLSLVNNEALTRFVQFMTAIVRAITPAREAIGALSDTGRDTASFIEELKNRMAELEARAESFARTAEKVVEVFKSLLQFAVLNVIFRRLGSAVGLVSTALVPFIRQITEFTREVLDALDVSEAWAAALAALPVALGILLRLGPAGWLSAFVVALSSAGDLMFQFQGRMVRVGDVVKTVWSDLTGFFTGEGGAAFVDGMKRIFGDALSAINPILMTLKQTVTEALQSLTGAGEGASGADILVAGFGRLQEAAASLAVTLKPVFDQIRAAWDSVVSGFSDASGAIKAVFDQLSSASIMVGGEVTPLFEMFGTTTGTVFKGLVVGVGTLAAGFVVGLAKIIEWVGMAVSAISSWFVKSNGDLTLLGQTVVLLVQAFVTGLTEIVSGFPTVQAVISDFVNAVVTWFTELPNLVVSALSNLGDAILSIFQDAFNNVLAWLEGWGDRLTGWISGIAGRISNAFNIRGSVNVTDNTGSGGGVISAQQRALGGPVEAGRAYIAGENGRELFVPSTDGMIYTAGETRQMVAAARDAQTFAQQANMGLASASTSANLALESGAKLASASAQEAEGYIASMLNRAADATEASQRLARDTASIAENSARRAALDAMGAQNAAQAASTPAGGGDTGQTGGASSGPLSGSGGMAAQAAAAERVARAVQQTNAQLPTQSAFVQEILDGYRQEAELARMTAEQKAVSSELERVQNLAKQEGILLSQQQLDLIRQQASEAQRVSEQQELISEYTGIVRTGIGNAIKEGLDGGDARAAISNLGKNIRDRAIDGLLEALVNEGVVKAISNLFSGIGGGGGGGVGGGFLSAIFGNLFARGGIMTSEGAMPLKRYQRGGVARSPQLAMFGEGSVPEAYVPVPSGKIPVEMPAMNSGAPSTTNISMTIHTNDADSFRRAQPQIFADAQRKLARQGSRNN